MSQKIVPNIWFNGNATEAAEFYVTVFPNSKIVTTEYYPNSAEEGLADFQLNMAGKPLSVEFELGGYHMVGINADASFRPNPALSFMLNFDPSRSDDARQKLDELWAKLAEGGTVLMPLGEYPFSKWYGWIEDKYGVSWQLILTNPDGEPRPFLIPSLLFGAGVQNRAAEAVDYYTSVFQDSGRGLTVPYGQSTGPATAESLMFSDFTLDGEWLTAMDSGVTQTETFSEGVSLAVMCKDQAEIDNLWSKLSAVPEAEQCGWCKDKFGVSWQIVPENIEELMKRPGAYAKLMQMHKLVIDEF